VNPTIDCWTCKSNTGEKRISPGQTIFEGSYWVVEHAYPIKTIGWLVIVLRRHAEALHELTTEEFFELAQIQAKLTKVLFEELYCEKEYVSCFAETEHFYHIHFHVFAKPADLPEELKGGKSFALLRASPEVAVPAEEVITFCDLLKTRFIHTA
jgi:diadenosine tetraphosphate (Ap4A) HIT family hydrolase